MTLVWKMHDATAELDMDWIHPWIGLDWIGSDYCNPLFFHLYILYINN